MYLDLDPKKSSATSLSNVIGQYFSDYKLHNQVPGPQILYAYIDIWPKNQTKVVDRLTVKSINWDKSCDIQPPGHLALFCHFFPASNSANKKQHPHKWQNLIVLYNIHNSIITVCPVRSDHLWAFCTNTTKEPVSITKPDSAWKEWIIIIAHCEYFQAEKAVATVAVCSTCFSVEDITLPLAVVSLQSTQWQVFFSFVVFNHRS